ncbi:DUF4297 domain-containing protein [Clostridium estertheticum]|uniref:dsDNA nuclease domain-containing protein n=1 Tax=Clostridium estertheticum TaxID=238834 RepID=UPI0013E9867F|nr:dsDNA nuclease domain-containing protein [Clostridium estertheticum]MBZ9688444.1 DUF4297 domain-containing protein [Clostridium estertheticum]
MFINTEVIKDLSDLSKETLEEVRSPLTELSEKDCGDETQKRFRYQHTVSAYLAFLMYSKKIAFEEILCEQHEDIIGVMNNGKFRGIQVKTRQLSDGPFKLSDDAVVNSICRFIENNKKFPGCFEKFVFTSNCDYLRNKTGESIQTLAKMLQKLKPPDYKFSPSTLDKYISKLEKKSNATRSEVIETLRITEFQIMPGLDDIESKIITEVLSKIDLCVDFSVEKLKHILDKMIYIVYSASSKKCKEPIDDYISLLNGDRIKNGVNSQVNTKRITKEMVENIIESFIGRAYYLAFENTKISLDPDRKKLMKIKMDCGMIDPDAIEVIDELRDKTEEYFLENYHKESLNSSDRKDFSHIRGIVKNQAIEAKVETKSAKKAYGSKMLTNIEKRLTRISEKRAADVDNCPYEILKGMVGVLTGECEVQFSDTPERGWKSE